MRSLTPTASSQQGRWPRGALGGGGISLETTIAWSDQVPQRAPGASALHIAINTAAPQTHGLVANLTCPDESHPAGTLPPPGVVPAHRPRRLYVRQRPTEQRPPWPRAGGTGPASLACVCVCVLPVPTPVTLGAYWPLLLLGRTRWLSMVSCV